MELWPRKRPGALDGDAAQSNVSEGDAVSTYGPIGKSNVPGGIPVGTIRAIRTSSTGNYLEAELDLRAI